MKSATERNRAKRARKPNGAGHILKRGGVWRVRIMVAGRVCERSLGTDDRAEAEAKAARLAVTAGGISDRQFVDRIARLRMASLADVSDAERLAAVPVATLFALYRDSVHRREVGERTMKGYAILFSNFERWLAREYPSVSNARDVSQGVADEFVAGLIRDGVSASGINKYLNVFAMVWRVAGFRHGLEYNPWTSERIPRRRLRGLTRRCLTEDECRAVVDGAGDAHGGELRTLLLIGMHTGMRLGDCVSLRWREIDLGARWIDRVTLKTHRRVRLPVSGRLLAELSARPADGEFVLPHLHSLVAADGDTGLVSEIVTRHFRRCGIETSQTAPNGRRVPLCGFHSLRHTFVTRLMEAGVPSVFVREAVGHSVMSMTEHYTHLGEGAIRAALDGRA